MAENMYNLGYSPDGTQFNSIKLDAADVVASNEVTAEQHILDNTIHLGGSGNILTGSYMGDDRDITPADPMIIEGIPFEPKAMILMPTDYGEISAPLLAIFDIGMIIGGGGIFTIYRTEDSISWHHRDISPYESGGQTFYEGYTSGYDNYNQGGMLYNYVVFGGIEKE